MDDEELIDILEPHYWNMGFKEGKEAQDAVRKSATYKHLLARDQQIALEAEIKIHDEYWHSQKYVENHGIGPLALANKEATELELRNLRENHE